ncbi:hypothetical protein [Diaminobutyricimonas sp. TR449]|uniref:lipopolysaccharide biosynthesis protein n=1 Tax=Diaminobutyricimonas sp. TR449 TaxID=2708076 RepID=UPI00141E0823|nr:hypothetical protein [Diaminobutyricimonas sp. TR449]
MRRTVGKLLRSPSMHLAAAAGLSGVATYVLLAIVARSVSADVYSDFSWFWSLTVVAGMGVFLPIEQETSRRLISSVGGRTPAASVLVVSLGWCLLLAIPAMLLAAPVIAASPDGVWLAVALFVSFLAYGVQFPVRGFLAGGQQMSRYAAVIGTEAALRVVLAVVVGVLFPNNAVLMASVVAVAALGSSLIGIAAIRGARFEGSAFVEVMAATARLVPSAIVVQLFLNFIPLLGYFFADNAALAGMLLAAVTLCRVPVFIYQALQSLVLPHVARAWHRAGPVSVGAVLGRTLAAATAACFGWVMVMVVFGNVLITLMFGSEFGLTTGQLAIIAVSLGLVALALVSSDCLLATGSPSAVAITWGPALVVAAIMVLVIPDPFLRATLPVGVAACVALAAALTALRARVRAHVA